MTTPNILGSIQQGLGTRAQLEQLGAIRDNREQARLAAKQQELIGGLRRKSLGLGGATPEQQQQAKLELLSADPKAAAQFFKSFEALPTPEQDRRKEQNQRIGTAAANLVQFPDEQLAAAINQTASAFANSGDEESARRAIELATLAQNDPQAARQRLSALETQSRDVEKVIASREKASLNKANQSLKDIDSDLKKSKNQFDQIDKLRNRVTAVSKEFTKVRDANNRLEAVFDTNKQAQIASDFAAKAQANPEAQDISQSTEAFGDMALIFNFMKMLDPGSTVREGEFASAQNTSGVDDKIINFYNQALKGTRLNDSQRAGLRAQSTGLFKTAKAQNDKDLARFRKSAKAFDLPEDQVFDIREEDTPSGVQGLEGFGDLSPEDKAELEALEASNVGS